MSSDSGLAAPAPWRDLGVRFVSAIVLAPAALACIWFGGLVWTIALAVIAAGLGAEWVSLSGGRIRSLSGALVPAFLVVAGAAFALVSPTYALGILVAGFAIVTALSQRPALGAGVLYAGLPYLSLLLLRGGHTGFGDVLFIVLVVSLGDIGAYLAGRLIGGPKLAPALSPGKTWSGSLGGLAASVAVGLGTVAALGGHQLGRAAWLAVLLAIVAQAGDLLESAIKRHYGKKDSGSIIPGHGGLFDRLDGLLAAAPAAMAVCLVTGQKGLGLWA